MNYTDIRHGTEEWRAARRKAITGTDVPSIIGNSKWKTPLSVWSRIVLDQGDRVEETAFMRWGNALEGVAASEFERLTGMAVERNDRLARHPKLPYFIGSPDGVVTDPLREDPGVIEFKAPSMFTRDEWSEGDAPAFYVNQLEAYLCITGLRWGSLCAILPPARADDELIVTTHVELTDERRSEIERTVQEWWERHVVREEQPDAIHRDEEYLRRLHPDDEPRTVLLEGELRAAVEEREALLAEVKAKKEQADDIKARLIQNIGSAAWATTGDDGRAYSFRTNKAGRRSLRSIPHLPKAAPMPEAS